MTCQQHFSLFLAPSALPLPSLGFQAIAHIGFLFFLSEASFMVLPLPPTFFLLTFLFWRFSNLQKNWKNSTVNIPHIPHQIIQLTIHQLLPFCYIGSLSIWILLKVLSFMTLHPKHFQQNHSALSTSKNINIICIVSSNTYSNLYFPNCSTNVFVSFFIQYSIQVCEMYLVAMSLWFLLV